MNGYARLTAALTVCFGCWWAPDVRAESTWTPCGDEKSYCQPLNKDKTYTIRYGTEKDGKSAYFFTQVKGTEKWYCGNILGNPMKSVTKSCAFTESSLPVANEWTNCNISGKTCDTGSNNPRLVRVKLTDGSWYTIVASGTIKCPSGNSKVSVKNCVYGPELDPDRFTDDAFDDSSPCATEFNDCDLGSMSMALVRYGAQDTWNYAVTYANYLKCNNDTFGNPLAHVTKSCQILPYYGLEVGADWAQIADCEVEGCTLTATLAYGTTSTHTVSDTSTYTCSWQEAVQGGFKGSEAAPWSLQVSLTATQQWSNSHTVTDALATTTTVTVSESCGANPAGMKSEMYQFTMPTNQDCFIWDCGKSTVDAMNAFQCIVRQPSDTGSYPGPQCLPGKCANQDCSVCEPDNAVAARTGRLGDPEQGC